MTLSILREGSVVSVDILYPSVLLIGFKDSRLFTHFTVSSVNILQIPLPLIRLHASTLLDPCIMLFTTLSAPLLKLMCSFFARPW